ncbi:glycosyl transferase family 1 [Thermogymnomonas acidicola]|uniref:Glycosyl transferase family 1 n=1 Tax=Thermogymnomonas acidicola TaxID=399579 RepID=A0AA37BQG9_9ARCH|nr:AarF/ABC1/UbiB kinase family protein [Thermogymnomonas acidicola]GGM69581.1 glycosyl transferase family 1 [Thermogymnomonas acidicola]
MDAEERDILKGIRRREIPLLLKIYPIFRHYIKDRESAKKDGEKSWSHLRERNGRKAVETFIELGPTFIKLGQILSARPDLLPKEYLKSFERLQDDVPPAPFEKVKPIIERNIGRIEDVFEEFNTNAISGASLGQVYRAKYRGVEVAVKVNRPDVEFIIKRDLVVIERLLKLAEGRIENFLYLSLRNVINDFKVRIFDEIDYRKEAENARRIMQNTSGRERVIVPEVFREVSGKEVMVSRFYRGIKVTDVVALRKSGIDLKDLAFRVDLLFMRMLLRDDIFHADPHPGNISVLEDGTIVLYDFGMVGSLDEKTRFNLLSLYDGLVRRDPEAIIDALLALNALSPAANRGIIRRSIEVAMMNFYGRSPDELEIRELLEIANDVIFEFPFRLPRSLVLYMRMSSLLEGICQTLDPDFKFIKVLRTLLYTEGLLDELYRKQLEEFVRKAIDSVQRGLDVLPLLKRKLESETEEPPRKRDRSVPLSIFLGFVLLSAVFVYTRFPLLSLTVILIDIASFGYIVVRRR